MRPRRGFIARTPTPAVDMADSSIRGGQGFGLFFKPNWNSQPKIAASRRDAPGSSAAGLYSTAGGAWGLVASTVL